MQQFDLIVIGGGSGLDVAVGAAQRGLRVAIIEKGKYGDLTLDGLTAVLASRAAGNFWKGNWTAALYLDARANSKQRKAMGTIFGGKAGGPPAMLARLISALKGVRYVQMKFDAKKIWASIPGILEYQLKPTKGETRRNQSSSPITPSPPT